MARNISGYDRIVDNVMALPENDAFLEEFMERAADPRLVGHFFQLNGQNAVAYFNIQFGPDPTREKDGKEVAYASKRDAYSIRIQDGEWHFPVDATVTQFMNDFFQQIWNTERCRTYNCDKDRARRESDSGLRDRVPSMPAGARKAAYAQIKELKATKDWQEEFTGFVALNSKQAIIEAMRRFPGVADDVFATALAEFIAERVIDD